MSVFLASRSILVEIIVTNAQWYFVSSSAIPNFVTRNASPCDTRIRLCVMQSYLMSSMAYVEKSVAPSLGVIVSGMCNAVRGIHRWSPPLGGGSYGMWVTTTGGGAASALAAGVVGWSLGCWVGSSLMGGGGLNRGLFLGGASGLVVVWNPSVCTGSLDAGLGIGGCSFASFPVSVACPLRIAAVAP